MVPSTWTTLRSSGEGWEVSLHGFGVGEGEESDDGVIAFDGFGAGAGPRSGLPGPPGPPWGPPFAELHAGPTLSHWTLSHHGSTLPTGTAHWTTHGPPMPPRPAIGPPWPPGPPRPRRAPGPPLPPGPPCGRGAGGPLSGATVDLMVSPGRWATFWENDLFEFVGMLIWVREPLALTRRPSMFPRGP